MKKNVVRIIGFILLLILMIQNICFADIIDPGGPRSHKSPPTVFPKNKTEPLIEISKGQLVLLVFLCILAFISLFVVVYYFLSNYSKKNIEINFNGTENNENLNSSENELKEWLSFNINKMTSYKLKIISYIFLRGDFFDLYKIRGSK